MSDLLMALELTETSNICSLSDISPYTVTSNCSSKQNCVGKSKFLLSPLNL